MGKLRLLDVLREPRQRALLLLAVFVAGAGWVWLSRVPLAEGQAPALRASPQEGFLAPDFTLESLEGRQVNLSALRGKVVVVNLWASWCPPCRAEMPALDKLYDANRARGLEVLAVNATNQDSERDARAFVQQLGLSFPILLDRAGTAGQRYLLRSLPTTIFIDRRGVIRSIVVGGPMSEALIRSKIENLLRGAP
jgi:cytochrome c biogenesis protein CcmG, thiol:disulfide interchange protein DsbE